MKAIFIFLLSPFSLYCQVSLDSAKPLTPIQLAKLQNPIEFDGKIGEGEWDAVDTLSMASHWPSFSATPNKRTQMRVAYDDRYLYFSALCYENPDAIQATTFERDIWNLTMDQIALNLDTYNDNENALIFMRLSCASAFRLSPSGSTNFHIKSCCCSFSATTF